VRKTAIINVYDQCRMVGSDARAVSGNMAWWVLVASGAGALSLWVVGRFGILIASHSPVSCCALIITHYC
jgi:hypothetical protein